MPREAVSGSPGTSARTHPAPRLTHTGKALWQALPHELSRAQWYRDTHSGNLIAVVRRGDTATKIAVDRSGAIDTAFHVAAVDLEGAIRGGELVRMR